jgi:hypothetical protein
MATATELVLRQRVCRYSLCRTIFYICRCCDRGQRYCREECRKICRREQCRAANRRHQQSDEGRLDHQDHQRAYLERKRLRKIVTDQPSVDDYDCVRVAAVAVEATSMSTYEVEELRFVYPPRCQKCGREGVWVEIGGW